MNEFEVSENLENCNALIYSSQAYRVNNVYIVLPFLVK